MMTSAVGPADVSVDRSTLTGQRSTVKGRSAVVGPHWSASARGWQVGPLGRAGKEKTKKGSGLVLGPKEVMGRLEAHRLGLGSQGQLGLRLSRPARANGLATRAAG
jgi:hypothetical protein